MKEKTSALHSKYIIDGSARTLTPAEMLDDCLAVKSKAKETPAAAFEPIVDESTDPSTTLKSFKSKDIHGYLSEIAPLVEEPRRFLTTFPELFTKSRISKALLDVIWMNGHFKLNDLTLGAKWRWNSKPLGDMAAFYASAEAAADFISGLGIGLSGYSFTESGGGCQVSFKVGASPRAETPDDDDADIFLPEDAPFGSEHPVLGRKRAVGCKFEPDASSWIVYVPFDTCDFRLGESLLCEASGPNGDNFPEVGDADYFIDCYEVVREFVEDKVPAAAVTVCDGGLVTALNSMCSEDIGADVDISGIMSAYGESDSVRVLFSEVPGVLLQIRDIDYDYVDAEFLLQDIAYYPIGHPAPGKGKVSVKSGGSGPISGILASLLNGQASEGED